MTRGHKSPHRTPRTGGLPIPIGDRWKSYERADWIALAQAWLGERRGGDQTGGDVSDAVVYMSFTATPEQQWEFVLAAMECARSQDDLDHIAAGPVQHLLGNHGAEFIDAAEGQASVDSRFARMLQGVLRYAITDDVWARIEALKTRG